jgi:hypothetical protein
MTFDWQNVAAALLVVTAAAYLGRQSWLVLARKKSSGCGTCAKCPVEAATSSGQPLVSIEALVRTARVRTARKD